MTSQSYLLPLDGSKESQTAAYFAWELASCTGSSITAQHVVDTPAVWRFLAHDLAGFVGSGLYLDARERIIETMRSVAEALMLSYSSQIDGQSLESEQIIDEGDPATEIARRAHNHDLVILGYHEKRRAARSLHLFQKLGASCPCPILIVRNTTKSWSKMQILASGTMADSKSIAQMYQRGTMLAVPIEVYLDHELSPAEKERFAMGGWSSALGVHSIQQGDFNHLISTAPSDTLLLVSSESLDGQYAARFSARLKAFLEASDQRALLLWPSFNTAAERIAS